MKKNKQAVTFVELLITISVLAILSAVGFLSLSSYLTTVRDSSRLVEIENIESSLGAFVLKNGHYPDPTNGQNITYSGSTVWTQGTFGNSVSFEIGYSKDIVDPLTKNEYTYSIKNTKKEYSIAGVFEERPGLVYNNSITPSANAGNNSNKKGIALVRGNYNGEIVSTYKNGVTNILALPSIVTTDLTSLDLQDIINNKKLVYDKYANLPASYNGSVYKTSSDIDFSANKLLVYSGSISNLNQSYNQVAFLQDLYLSYSGSQVANELSIYNIDKNDLFSPEPSLAVRNLACDLINFKLKYFVECGQIDYITFFVINVLHIDIANLPGTKITAVYQDSNQNFVFGTNDGVAFYDGTNWVTYKKITGGLVHNSITSITQDNAGVYWIGTDNGISKLTMGDYVNKADDIWQTIGSSKLTSTHVQYVYTDNDGIVWIGTNGGANSYDGDIWKSFTKNSEGLSQNDITAIYTDRQGHIWFGTESKGVDKFTFSDTNCNNFWRHDKDDDDDDHDGHDHDHDGHDEDHHCDRNGYKDDEGNHHDNDDHDGHEENGHHFDGSEDTTINYKGSKLPNDNVTYIFQDSSQKMWIGTEGGIGITTNYGTTWSKYTTANTSGGLIGNNITYLFQDTAGNVWVGTTTGLSKFNGTTWTTYSTSNGLSGNSVFLINQDTSGNVIIFSNGGLDTIDASGNIIS